MVDLAQKKRDRARFHIECYNRIGGNRVTFIEHRKVGSELGFEWAYTKEILQFLVDECFIEYKSHANIMLTHLGMMEAEDLLQDEDNESDFSPTLTFNQNIDNSVRVDGSPNTQVALSGSSINPSQTNVKQEERKSTIVKWILDNLTKIIIGIAIIVVAAVILHYIGIQ